MFGKETIIFYGDASINDTCKRGNISVPTTRYKKLIKDLNFLSSLSGYQPSINSNMVWSSILDDKEIYSFLNGDNIISFYHTYSYKKICDKLKTFYEYKNSKIILDDDFCIRYNIQDRDKFIKDNI